MKISHMISFVLYKFIEKMKNGIVSVTNGKMNLFVSILLQWNTSNKRIKGWLFKAKEDEEVRGKCRKLCKGLIKLKNLRKWKSMILTFCKLTLLKYYSNMVNFLCLNLFLLEKDVLNWKRKLLVRER